MSITVKRITPALGAMIEGIALSEELTAENKQRIENALLEHHILFFRDQPLTPQQQCDFARHFGTLHTHPIYPVLQDLPEIMVIDTHAAFLPDNDNWHIDVTFSQTPPLGGILAAKQLPSVGGDTLWTSAAAAYDALSASFRRFLDDLSAEHSVVKSYPAARWGSDAAFKTRYEAAVQKYPPVSHPVIRTHPVTGRKSLFVNEGFTTRINELSQQESDVVLKYLFAHVTKPEFVLRWKWQVNDVAFWDNRITQHYAVADYLPERRIMHRATINGDKPF